MDILAEFLVSQKRGFNEKFIIRSTTPIIPTYGLFTDPWMVDSSGKLVGQYTIHGSYGFWTFSTPAPQKTKTPNGPLHFNQPTICTHICLALADWKW